MGAFGSEAGGAGDPAAGLPGEAVSTKQEPASLFALSPILVFLLLVVGGGLLSGDITRVPILVAFTAAAAWAFCLNPPGTRLSVAEKMEIFVRGSGESTILILVFVFLLAGAFYALTVDIGARDATVQLALRFVLDAALLPGLFLVSCVISFAMGTSMGTLTAVAPIGIGLAESTGVGVPLVLGIVIGGAMFGDNLSFISDTTIAATRTQRVRLADKFRVNVFITIPAVVLTCAFLLTVPISGAAQLGASEGGLLLVLPYVLIVAAALLGMNVLAVLAIGVLAAGLTGLVTGQLDVWGVLASIQKGMGWMQNLAVIALVIGGIVGLMRADGGIRWLLTRLLRGVRSARGAELRMAALVALLDVAVAKNTIAIVTAGPVAREVGAQFGVDPRRIAGLLDVFACVVQGLIPYGGQLLTAAALAGLSPLVIVPWCIYPMALLGCGLLAIASGRPRLSGPARLDV